MKTFHKWLVFFSVVFLGMYGYFKYSEVQIQEETYKLQKEEHIDTLYGIYQSNMSNCLSQARENKKSNQEINETCIKELNGSIVAEWLKEYGFDYLLEKKLSVDSE